MECSFLFWHIKKEEKLKTLTGPDWNRIKTCATNDEDFRLESFCTFQHEPFELLSSSRPPSSGSVCQLEASVSPPSLSIRPPRRAKLPPFIKAPDRWISPHGIIPISSSPAARRVLMELAEIRVPRKSAWFKRDTKQKSSLSHFNWVICLFLNGLGWRTCWEWCRAEARTRLR